jgi:hypothetical protein
VFKFRKGKSVSPKWSDRPLRVALEQLLCDTADTDISPQVDLVRRLRNKHPHTIEIVQLVRNEDPSSWNYGCFEFALGLNNLPVGDRLRSIKYEEHRGRILRNFVDWICEKELIRKCAIDQAIDGDMVLYSDRRLGLRHAGLVRENNVVSKWGLGHLWRHRLWEIPTSYGDSAQTYTASEPSQVIAALKEFAKVKGGLPHIF